jgi:uncharacterized SAM-binding protein YcdF (DUF218 family)
LTELRQPWRNHRPLAPNQPRRKALQFWHMPDSERSTGRNAGGRKDHVKRLIIRFSVAVVAGLAALLLLLWLEALPEPAAKLLREGIMLFKDPVETSFQALDLRSVDRVSGIVVLGGQYSRFHAAARLASRFPEARMMVTGASSEELTLLRSEMPHRRVEVDASARNTFENACHALRLANPRPGDRWLLVTSALHMPRAVGAFRGYGFDVLAFPVRDSNEQPRYAAPVVLREMTALLVYRLRGWMSFPPPCPHSTPLGR